ncbi:V-type immunoglobulin domain-containing suppressor of T-cell activation [Pantherophis guttatus]|uniref:V-type immunoglobulin domain-containing suppressor of T-cell activation n=1 Tax=Pantherophis guttatus TaxID=94885 RepID=UPI001483AD8B|nr:V-type immunoglobulin domain-containing suppressor of T-cell activation [Pantherophis guttatus]
MEASAKWGLLLQLGLLLTRLQVHLATFETITPYSLYVCPEGQNLTLTCKISGVLANHHDLFAIWYFSNKNDRSCSQRKHIHNITAKQLHHEAEMHHRQLHGNVTAEKYAQGHQVNYYGLEFFSNHRGTFHVTIANLTLQDRGYYCCYIIETKKEKNKPHILHHSYGFMELRIQKANGLSPNCTFHLDDNTENTTAVIITTAACIIGILCLPFILLLIYKQRQIINNRRAHELVRMDSNAHGIENPVFDAVPDVESESRIRPQLSFMASRQASESDRHLLSEPNTPLSPPAPGECFFPSLDPVPDSPDLTKESSKEDVVF